MNPKILLSFVLVFCMSVETVQSQTFPVYISEIQTSNTKTVKSPVWAEYADWIELINTSGSEFDLGGYYLSDDLSINNKWVIPANTKIPANGVLVFWADNRDAELHTNFKLSRDGEAVGLFSPSGEVIDSITFGYQQDDYSFGRLSDNIFEWTVFSTASPNKVNNSSTDIGVGSTPEISLPGGFYQGSQSVAIRSSTANSKIYYTLDGTIPDTLSHLYSVPVNIDSTLAFRVRSFAPGKLPSQIVTNTYLINQPHFLPVVSLVTDPDNFFDDKIGIYVTGTNGKPGDCDQTVRNVNQDWERPVNVEFYETSGEQRLNQGAGVRIFGGCSRTRYPEKSLALYARNVYGKGSFDYQFFPSKKVTSFDTFVLRSSSDDQVSTMFRDGLAHTVLSEGMDADIQAYRPAVVFLNGQYWGIHNIREKVNEHYFRGNFDIADNNLNILERDPYQSWNTVFGSAVSYNNMMNYIKSHSMATENYYTLVKSQMDVDNFINYMIGHIYLGEHDWPGNNIRFWKANTGKYSKWRWVNYDMDQSFQNTNDDNIAIATEPNGPGWPNPPWSTLLLRSLLLNQNFKNEFIQRYAFFLSTTFKSQNLISTINRLRAVIAPEIPRHITKWGGRVDPDNNEGWTSPTFNSVSQWESNVQGMRDFATQRPAIAILHIVKKFGLTGNNRITVSENITGAGTLKVTGKNVPNEGYSGYYFKNIPFSIEAVPTFGYRFLYWKSGATKYPKQKIDVTLTKDSTFTAYFEKSDNDSDLVVINEINYNSVVTFDSGDWVELYNRRTQSVDISGWKLEDKSGQNSFVIPKGTELAPRSYFVLSSDLFAFQSAYPTVANREGSFSFGFKNGGDVIYLISNDNTIIDSVEYDNKSPWPVTADGAGATIELKNPWYNNDDPLNWSSSTSHGTPGAKNSTATGIGNNASSVLPDKMELAQNFPNPFNPATKIRFSLIRNGTVKLEIHNILGQLVRTLVNSEMTTGNHFIEWNGKNEAGISVSSGIYIYSLSSGGKQISKSMLLMK